MQMGDKYLQPIGQDEEPPNEVLYKSPATCMWYVKCMWANFKIIHTECNVCQLNASACRRSCWVMPYTADWARHFSQNSFALLLFSKGHKHKHKGRLSK